MMAQATVRMLPGANIMNVDKPMESGKAIARRCSLRLPFFAIFMLVDLMALARFERIRDFSQTT